MRPGRADNPGEPGDPGRDSAFLGTPGSGSTASLLAALTLAGCSGLFAIVAGPGALLKVLGVWTLTSGLGGALYSALALLAGEPPRQVADAGGVGVGVGFLLGVGPTLGAALYVVTH